MATYPTLIAASARLAAVAPQDWQAFLGAFTAYAQQQTQNCIQSSLEELPRAQGRAQIAAETLGIFADCLKANAKLEQRK